MKAASQPPTHVKHQLAQRKVVVAELDVHLRGGSRGRRSAAAAHVAHQGAPGRPCCCRTHAVASATPRHQAPATFCMRLSMSQGSESMTRFCSRRSTHRRRSKHSRRSRRRVPAARLRPTQQGRPAGTSVAEGPAQLLRQWARLPPRMPQPLRRSLKRCGPSPSLPGGHRLKCPQSRPHQTRHGWRPGQTSPQSAGNRRTSARTGGRDPSGRLRPVGRQDIFAARPAGCHRTSETKVQRQRRACHMQ